MSTTISLQVTYDVDGEWVINSEDGDTIAESAGTLGSPARTVYVNLILPEFTPATVKVNIPASDESDSTATVTIA